MALSYQEVTAQGGILETLASTFQDNTNAGILLRAINCPTERIPQLPEGGDQRGYWLGICDEIHRESLLTASSSS